MKQSLLFIVLVAALAGCGTTAKFIYPADSSKLVHVCDSPKHDMSVAVVPFEDHRPSKNNSAGWWLYLIPAMPWGEATYERPDGARMFFSINEYNFDVPEDLAKAAATSLRQSGMFKDVFFTYGGEKDNAGLLLKGTIDSTLYKGKIISYGLSVYGPLLWYVGLPGGESINHLSIKLQLVDRRTNQVRWEHAFSKDSSVVQSLYYNTGQDCINYAAMMQEGMNEAILALDAANLDLSSGATTRPEVAAR